MPKISRETLEMTSTWIRDWYIPEEGQVKQNIKLVGWRKIGMREKKPNFKLSSYDVLDLNSCKYYSEAVLPDHNPSGYDDVLKVEEEEQVETSKEPETLSTGFTI